MRQRIKMQGEFLVLASTPNDAKQIEAYLRAEGHPIRLLVAPGLDSFIDILEKSAIGLVIHDTKFDGANLIQVTEAVQRFRPGTPVLGLGDTVDARSVIEAISKGARGVVSLSNLQHLDLVCQREFETKQLHQEVQRLKDRLDLLEEAREQDLEASAVPSLKVQEGIIVQANHALVSMLNLDEDDLFGWPLMDLVAPNSQAQVKTAVKAVLKGKAGDEAISFGLCNEKGAQFQFKAHFFVSTHDDDPAVEIRGAESLSAPDEANSGFGRQQLYKAVSNIASNSGDQIPAVVFTAVDNFEDVEKRAGFAAAEELVSQILRMLSSQMVEDDQLFRFSLSEFVIIGSRADVEDLAAQVRHFQSSVEGHIFKAGEKEITCTVSTLIYPLQDNAEHPEELLRQVREETLTLESEGGNRNKISGRKAEELENRKRQAEWEEQILKALEDDRFDLAYQNIASLTGETRQYSDVLVRMLDQRGKELMAREFLPFAEDLGLMTKIDRWVITRAVQVALEQLSHSVDACFFVRIAEDTLAEGDTFVQWLTELVEANPKISGHLVLALREKHLQNNMRKAQKLIAKAQQLNLEVALDHFGTSRHSHQLMPRLGVDYVKLHADFTASVAKPGSDLSNLETIMDVARNHKVRTIAERVADANSMARLWHLGVNLIMGSHVHEPDRELSNTRFRMS